MGCTGNSGYLYRCSARAESFLFKDKVRLPAEVLGTAKTAISVRLTNLAGKGGEVKGFVGNYVFDNPRLNAEGCRKTLSSSGEVPCCLCEFSCITLSVAQSRRAKRRPERAWK